MFLSQKKKEKPMGKKVGTLKLRFKAEFIQGKGVFFSWGATSGPSPATESNFLNSLSATMNATQNKDVEDLEAMLASCGLSDIADTLIDEGFHSIQHLQLAKLEHLRAAGLSVMQCIKLQSALPSTATVTSKCSNCDFAVSTAPRPNGGTWKTCCRGCGLSSGNKHDPTCSRKSAATASTAASVSSASPAQSSSTSQPSTSNLPKCQHCTQSVSTAPRPNGGTWKTCCRGCGISSGTKHDSSCGGTTNVSAAASTSQPSASNLTKCHHCNYSVSTAPRPNGGTWKTCCRGCGLSSGAKHDATCAGGGSKAPNSSHSKHGIPLVWYHGTSKAVAQAISQGGFKASTGGALGPGVYVSADVEKAVAYRKTDSGGAVGTHAGDDDKGAIIECRLVGVHTSVRIKSQQDPNRLTWGAKFDMAYAEIGAVGHREENCVRDAAKVQFVRVLSAFEMQKAAEGHRLGTVKCKVCKSRPINKTSLYKGKPYKTCCRGCAQSSGSQHESHCLP